MLQSQQYNIKTTPHHLWSPPGLNIGPLLFLIYINDLGNISNSIKLILFADDSNLFINGKDINEIATKLNLELKNIQEWLKSNRLSLNIKKTQYIIFTQSRKKEIPDLKIIINNENIQSVKQCKF